MSQQNDPAHVVMPGVHRIASLLKRWLLGTHQGSVGPDHLDAYLNEFTFRFNRRGSRRRGLLFYRLLEQAILADPITYRSLIVNPRPGRPRPTLPKLISAIAGGPATLAEPNLTQIDTPSRGLQMVLIRLPVLDSVEVLAVEVGERGAVAGVAEEQVEHRPDEREAAGLAGEPAHHFRAPADLAERSFEEVRRSPSFAVSEGVAEVHDQGVEVVGEAAGGGLVAGVFELRSGPPGGACRS